MAKIIWTRSLDNWNWDKKLFDDPGMVYHLPCIHCIDLVPDLPTTPPTYVIFTSGSAVEKFFANTDVAKLAAGARYFTFGQKTAEKLNAQQVNVERIPAKSALDFATQLLQKIDNKPVWLPGPESPVFDMEAFLKKNNHTATKIDLYRTVSEVPTGYRIRSNIDGPICFASPSALEGFKKFIPPSDRIFHDYPAIAIGETTAKVCRDFFGKVFVAKSQTLEALRDEAIFRTLRS